MRTINFFIILMLFSSPYLIHAQDQTDQRIKDWQRAKTYTLEYMEAMPADKFDFKPTEKVRSFAQQMLHITDANYGFSSAAAGVESPVGRGESEKTQDTSREHVIQLVKAGYDFVINQLESLPADQLQEKIKFFDKFEITRGTAFDKAFEHQTHHRGQTTIYLRLAGVDPPKEILF